MNIKLDNKIPKHNVEVSCYNYIRQADKTTEAYYHNNKCNQLIIMATCR